MTQETLITKKRRGPKPTGQGVLVGVRLHPDELAAVDTCAASEPDPKPTRPEMIRRLVREATEARAAKSSTD